LKVLIIDHAVLKSEEKELNIILTQDSHKVKIGVSSFREVFSFEKYLKHGNVFSCHYKPFDFDDLGRSIMNGYNRYFVD